MASRYCAVKYNDLKTSLCVKIRVNDDLYTPCPINHHLVMGRGIYNLLWQIVNTNVCTCGKNHNPMLCPKEKCRMCRKIGHWDLICPEADRHIWFITKDGYSPSLITCYTQDLSKIITVSLMSSVGLFQQFHLVYDEDEYEKITVDEFYQKCTLINCTNCGRIGNPMVCQCASKKRCLRCTKKHHIMLCPAVIPD